MYTGQNVCPTGMEANVPLLFNSTHLFLIEYTDVAYREEKII